MKALKTLAILAVGYGLAQPVFSASVVVTNLADSGPGTLREALSGGSVTVTFAPNLSGQALLLTNGPIGLEEDEDYTIDASALPGGLQINGNDAGSLFTLEDGASAEITSLTLIDGYASVSHGGAITVNKGASLTLTACTLAGNTCANGFGGAILVENGTATLNNCTLTANSAATGGAMAGILGSFLFMTHCTVTENSSFFATATNGGGGIAVDASTLTLTNCIVAENSAQSGQGPDIWSETTVIEGSLVTGVVSSSYSIIGNAAGSTITNGENGNYFDIIGVNPDLSPLGYYGGPTTTMPPLPGSPAIDAAEPTSDTTDQRGFPRPQGLAPDIGAVEVPTPVVTVTNASDSGAGSLRQVLTQSGGEIVHFATNLSGSTILLTSGELLLNKACMIDASALAGGIQINGNDSSRIIEVSSGQIAILTSLTLTNGYASAGGAILSAGNLTVNECSIVGNSVSSGGAGGGIYNNTGQLTLNECTITRNSAPTGAGGGVFDLSSGAPVIINQCTLSSNVATTGGGIGSANLGSNNVTLFNSIVAGNTASSGTNLDSATAPILLGTNLLSGNPKLLPLGIYFGPTPTMPPGPNSPAIDAGSDSATNLFATDQNGWPRLSGAHVDIGAVEAPQAVTSIADSGVGSLRDVIALTPESTISFAPALSGQTISLNSELLLNRSLVLDASALPGGLQLNGNQASRIFQIGVGQTVVLNSLTLTNGSAGNGGAIFNAGNLTLNECSIVGNSVSAGGGGIYNEAGELTLDECTVASNSAAGGGGGIFNFTGGTPVVLNQCTVSGNTASTGGGIASENVGPNNVTLLNSIVAGNTASSGANLDSSTTPSLIGSNLLSGNPMLAPLGNYGGATPTMPPLVYSPVIDAGNDAAAAALGLTTDQRGLPRVSGAHVDIGSVEFQKPVVTNTADSGPGSLRQAVAAVDAGGTITFAPSLSGQTILLTNGEIDITNSLDIDASSLPQGVQINGNQASSIFYLAPSTGPVSLNALTLTNGSAVNGGGAIAMDFGSTLTMANCTIVGNTTSVGNGGAIRQLSGTLTLSECTLSNNSALAGSGGAIYQVSGTLTLNECTLSGNSALGGSGGAIDNSLYEFAGTLTLNECTLFGNSAPNGSGGAIYNSGSEFSGGPLNVNQCTLSGNSAASAGAIFINTSHGSKTSISNSIVAGNTTPDVAGTFAGSPNLIGGNPLLAALGNYGGPTQTMPPLPGSPATDAATNSIFATDQRGFPRVLGPGPDLGAVEGTFNPAGAGGFTGITHLANGAFLFGFTNYSGITQTILTTTNLALPLREWSVIGTGSESSPGSGHFEFIEVGAVSPTGFYRVRSP